MKASIIVPVFNSSDHVEKCFNGLSKQTFKEFDVFIVADNRSTDSTIKVAEDVIGRFSNSSLIIQQDDSRAGGARNLGLDASDAEYVWFLDVDDYPHPSFLEEMLRIADDTDADVVVCNQYYSKECIVIYPPLKEYKITYMNNIQAMIELNAGKCSTNPSNKLFRKNYLEKHSIRMSSEQCEDYEFLTDCFMNDCTVVYYNKPLYTYVLAEGTRSSGCGNEMAKRDIEILEKLMRWTEMLPKDIRRKIEGSGFKHILHSLTNADKQHYNELINVKIIKEAMNRTGFDYPEIILFKTSKALYYQIGTYLRKRRYSRDKLLFDKDI